MQRDDMLAFLTFLHENFGGMMIDSRPLSDFGKLELEHLVNSFMDCSAYMGRSEQFIVWWIRGSIKILPRHKEARIFLKTRDAEVNAALADYAGRAVGKAINVEILMALDALWERWS